MRKIPVIYDCDPGHDDAIALVVALAGSRLDVRAVTASPGNQTVEKTTKNILKILELCKRESIPVASGRHGPLLQKLSVGAQTHGESGMDGPVLPEPTARPLEIRAAELMEKVISESKEPVTVIATGPLTNVAVFIKAYPHLVRKIEKISVMGGGAFIGNRSPLAEFNIWNDPEAAKIVFRSGVPLEVYGLDVTHKAMILKEEFSWFREREDQYSQFLADLLDFFAIDYMGRRKFPGCPIHDCCAVAGLIAPELFQYAETWIDVDLEGVHTRGACIVDLRPQERREHKNNGRIAMDVDRKKFVRLILDSCKILADGEPAGGST